MEKEIEVSESRLRELGEKLDGVSVLSDTDRAVLTAAFQLAGQGLAEGDEVAGFSFKGSAMSARSMAEALPRGLAGPSPKAAGVQVSVDTENWDVFGGGTTKG